MKTTKERGKEYLDKIHTILKEKKDKDLEKIREGLPAIAVYFCPHHPKIQLRYFESNGTEYIYCEECMRCYDMETGEYIGRSKE